MSPYYPKTGSLAGFGWTTESCSSAVLDCHPGNTMQITKSKTKIFLAQSTKTLSK